MGNVIQNHRGNRKDITDMKQRIAAAVLMMSVLCSGTAFAAESEPAEAGQSEFIAVEELQEITPPAEGQDGAALTAQPELPSEAAADGEAADEAEQPEQDDVQQDTEDAQDTENAQDTADAQDAEETAEVYRSVTVEERAEASDTMQEAFALYTSFTTRKSPWKGSNTYTVPADYNIFDGIDISKWHQDADWAALKKNGVEFAIVRCGYRGYGTGEMCEDVCYDEHMSGALKQGIPVGLYFYSQAITAKEAVEEADFCIKYAKKYNVKLPLVIDIEYAEDSNGFTGRLYKAKLSVAEQTKIAKAFCDRVEEAGYVPMVYASASTLRNSMDGEALAKEGMIWLAHYTTKTSYEAPYQYWQYSDSGKISGVNGNLDCNFYFTKGSSPTDLGSWSGSSEGTLRFETNGGSAVSAVTAQSGTTVVRPKAPTRDGYLFAGWYTDSALTKPKTTAWKMTAGTTTLYAKWVPQSMLNTIAQLSKGTDSASDKTSMRVLSSVDSTQYKSVGFVLSTTDKSDVTDTNESCTTVKTTTVYGSILADDESIHVDEIRSEKFCDESQYLFALTLNDIPNVKFDSEIYLRPFYITQDGTKVYGTTATKSVQNMLS